MLKGVVEGSAIATIKHPSMRGWKLLVVQPIGQDGGPDGDPLLAIDMLGAGHGTQVVISNDGRGAREMVGDNTSPVRWAVIGIVD
ncbi:MAG TPA: EutN/CcmL family microcompartment protein [Phycisphaerae bacterium]|nr:EutN/CcmL family microcompartment protein [Phycisphaerae bacterium]